MIASFLYDCGKFGESETLVDPDDLLPRHKLLILHGGEDISPSIYGESKGPAHAGNTPSHRDTIELAVLNRAVDLGVPVLAICRGAQLACAAFGGKLYQDVKGHIGGDHMLHIIKNDITVTTNSCHHQMMIPVGAEIIADAGEWRTPRWKGDRYVDELIQEPEVLIWRDRKVLGVQGHPEWSHSTGAHSIFRYTKQLLNEFFGV